MLREAEVQLGKGQSIGEVCRGLAITDQTSYRWRKEYDGLRVDQAKRLAEAAVQESCLELRLRGGQDERWTSAVSDFRPSCQASASFCQPL